MADEGGEIVLLEKGWILTENAVAGGMVHRQGNGPRFAVSRSAPINKGESGRMKTTLEIPDDLFRRAKSAAAEKGIALRELVSEALAERLRRPPQDKPWLKTFGKLRGLRKESARINRIIEEEFDRLETEDWQ